MSIDDHFDEEGAVRVVAIDAGWRYRPGPSIDEELWLRFGIIGWYDPADDDLRWLELDPDVRWPSREAIAEAKQREEASRRGHVS